MIENDNQKIASKYLYYGLSSLALAIVGIIASLSLRDGFSGDQTLFLIYSKAINNGAVLYKDVWDIKQPAIFVFYLIGGKLFGFTEIGIHLLEILYWLGLCLIMVIGLKDYFINPLFAILTPLFTVGIYYSVSGSLHFTQAEGLVCFPLFMSLWFCQKFLDNPQNRRFLFLSGLFGGIVLAFKLMFIVILSGFWFCLFIYCYFSFFRKNIKRVLVSIAFIFGGLLIPFVLVIYYFVQNNAMNDLWYTTFVYPFNAVLMETRMENRRQVLIDGLVWFFKSYFPVISLTLFLLILSLWSIFKDWWKTKKIVLDHSAFLFLGLFIWALSGFAVILIQRLSWWEYHYSLLMIPLGILAVKCLENLFEAIKNNSILQRKTLAYLILTVLLTPLFIPTARRFVDRIRQFNQVELIKIGDREFWVTGAAVGDYKSISADTLFLEKETPKARIFIVSNPLYYYLSDTPPLFASNGAMTDMFTNFEWDRLNSEMSKELPKYMFIEPRFIPMIEKQNKDFINILNNKYSIYTNGDRVTTYKLNK